MMHVCCVLQMESQRLLEDNSASVYLKRVSLPRVVLYTMCGQEWLLNTSSQYIHRAHMPYSALVIVVFSDLNPVNLQLVGGNSMRNPCYVCACYRWRGEQQRRERELSTFLTPALRAELPRYITHLLAFQLQLGVFIGQRNEPTVCSGGVFYTYVRYKCNDRLSIG